MTTTVGFVRSFAAGLLPHGWAVALLVCLSLAASAPAASITFAQFDESTNAGVEPFTFTNGSSMSSFSGTVNGNFQFLVSGLPTASQAAEITLTSTAVTPATAGGPFLSQPIDGATDTLTFTRISDNANLLSITFSGNLTGFDGDNSATLSADTANGDTTTYTSDFLNFSGTTERSLGLNLSLDPGFTQNADGFLDTFTADLTGAFSSSPAPTPVPEPSSIVLLGIAILAMLARRTRGFAALA